jgi:putative methyltransferase (TIGR04325 family)
MSPMKRIASAVLRRLRPPVPDQPPIWAGVYRDFDEIPQSGVGFGGHDAARQAEALLRETESDPMPDEAVVDHQLLALTVRLAGLDSVRILDLGGGVGQSYAALRRMVDRRIALAYCVVELPPIAEHGRSLWVDAPEITFATQLEDLPFAPDVVFAKGVIQYWPDYAGMFERLCALSASWLVIEKASLLDGREYATEQLNVYDSRIPYWFMDLRRLVGVADRSGYRLLLQRRLEREYDQSNFPPELRIGRAASLLFERIGR